MWTGVVLHFSRILFKKKNFEAGGVFGFKSLPPLKFIFFYLGKSFDKNEQMNDIFPICWINQSQDVIIREFTRLSQISIFYKLNDMRIFFGTTIIMVIYIKGQKATMKNASRLFWGVRYCFFILKRTLTDDACHPFKYGALQIDINLFVKQ